MQSTHRRTLLKTAGAGLIGSLGVGLIGNVFAAAKIKPAGTSALIVVDVQNCFVDGGTLPVSKGAEVVPIINKLSGAFENIVVTQDWHTQGHASFATSYPGKKVFETTKLSYGTQVLWPDHCVQGTDDAALHKDLKCQRRRSSCARAITRLWTATRRLRKPITRP
jgi:nicotinamidase/pyrazinamidase